MISEIAAEHGSTLDLTRRGICGISTNCPKAGGYPDFYAFADIGCYVIAKGIESTGEWAYTNALYRTDQSCYVKCGKAQYFALGEK